MIFASPAHVALAHQAATSALHLAQAPVGARIEVGLSVLLEGVRALRPCHRIPVLREIARRIFGAAGVELPTDQASPITVPPPHMIPAASVPLH